MKEIVIRIKDRLYNDIISDEGCELNELTRIIAKGKVLPERHGDLIDRNDLIADAYPIDDWSGEEITIIDMMTIELADAIIDAR